MLDLYPYKELINSDMREFVESLPEWKNTCENANALDRLLDKVNETLFECAQQFLDQEEEIDLLERKVEELEAQLEELGELV